MSEQDTKFICLECAKSVPVRLRRHPDSSVCQLCWFRRYPVLPVLKMEDVLVYFILHPELQMIHLPRVPLRELTRAYDAWTLPSRPVQLQYGVTAMPYSMCLRTPNFVPDPSEMDVEVTPVVFNNKAREVLFGNQNFLQVPFYIYDEGYIEGFTATKDLFHNFCKQGYFRKLVSFFQ